VRQGTTPKLPAAHRNPKLAAWAEVLLSAAERGDVSTVTGVLDLPIDPLALVDSRDATDMTPLM
jgi:hypothetical protein